MRRIEVRPQARIEIREARDWYEERGSGLGSQFLLSLDAVLQRAKRHPGSYPLAKPGVRRALLSRFPYLVLYRTEPTTIIVLAVFHAHRDPDSWSDRVHETTASYVGEPQGRLIPSFCMR